MSGRKATREVTAELLRRHDRPGPRYTSYPTAVEFHEGFGEAEYRARLERANTLGEAPLAIYSHVPFCEERCSFCGCHVIISPRKTIAGPYVEHLRREMEMVASLLPDRRRVAQYHLGGGTPTYLAPEELDGILRSFTSHFELLPGAELAIEVDPRVTSREQVDLLASWGFNRISMGVQDFTREVQEAVNRVQSEEETVALADYAREKGFSGLNIDLIYGLPYQRVKGFEASVEAVIRMKADRVAVYSFAFVPWMKGHQKKLPDEAFPGREEKFALFAAARERFLEAGYEPIGLDHFALPQDELAVARREGRLYRNFMGYTVMPGEDALGFGISSIGDVRGAFIQNEKKISTYYRALDENRLPVHKGYARSEDDERRRDVIQSLMCNFRVDRARIEAEHGIDFGEYFAEELGRLAPLVEEGLAEVDEREVRATAPGELFIRNIAMCFDAYLAGHEGGDRPVFSRTV
jgi:oxygen-independent coproporphyrinogen-3 oxidase